MKKKIKEIHGRNKNLNYKDKLKNGNLKHKKLNKKE